jgi:hypothetical protein
VQGDDVGRRDQLRERGTHDDAEVDSTCLDVRRTAGLRQGLDLDTERGGPLGHAQPDGAEPHDAQGRPEQPSGLAVRLLVPPTGPQVRHVVRDTPVDGQQQANGQLRHGGGVPARNVGDQHAPSRGGGRVDRVGPSPRADDQREPVSGLEDASGDLGAAHDEDVEPRDPAGEIRLTQARIDHTLMATCLELGDGLLRERVGEQELHPATSSDRAGNRQAVLLVTLVPLSGPHHDPTADVVGQRRAVLVLAPGSNRATAQPEPPDERRDR